MRNPQARASKEPRRCEPVRRGTTGYGRRIRPPQPLPNFRNTSCIGSLSLLVITVCGVPATRGNVLRRLDLDDAHCADVLRG